MNPHARPLDTASRALGFLSAWTVLGLGNAVAVSIDLPAPPTWFAVRLIHHLVDLGRHTAAGLLAAALVFGFDHWLRRHSSSPLRVRLWTLAALGSTALLVVATLVMDDLLGMARRTAEARGLPLWLVHFGLTGCAAALLPLAALAGGWLRRGHRRWLSIPLVFGMQWANVAISHRDNHGLHLLLSWVAATLLGFALYWPEGWVQELRVRRRTTRAALALMGALGLLGVALPLNNSQRIDLASWDANLLPHVVVRAGVRQKSDTDSARDNPFFRARAASPPIPARSHALLPKDGIVLLLSIDALRSDVLTKDRARRFPNLARLANSGTRFENARSPGSATVFTLSALSTGQHFSQRYWSKSKGDYWPVEDDAVHFPELLSAAGIRTLHAQSTTWLENERNILSGFEVTEFPKTDWKWARGHDLAAALIRMLEAHRQGPLFGFAHFLDSHDPYWPGRDKAKGAFQRYLHAVAYVDEQIGKILDALRDLGMDERAIVIVTADHGEAFGEHGTRGHATTLYEEQLRVPLLFWGKSIPAGRRDDWVSIVDLGPTILELFGQDTPASFMGESLLPLLERKAMTFQRPLAAEARLLQSIVFEDGVKVIRDRKSEVVEIYDLARDPKELENLSDRDDPRLQARVQRLVDFFETHTLRREGYEPPLRK